jgi:hypothetical protein
MYKYCPAETSNPMKKSTRIVYKTMMVNVIGMSTNVRAAASINRWYVAAFVRLSTIGRCLNRAGISAGAVNATNRIALVRFS